MSVTDRRHHIQLSYYLSFFYHPVLPRKKEIHYLTHYDNLSRLSLQFYLNASNFQS